MAAIAPSSGVSIWKTLDDQKRLLDATEQNLKRNLEEVLKDDDEALSAVRQVSITYTNYKGETAERKIIPHSGGLRFGTSKWHHEPQWLVSAYDVDKKADREFALKDIKYIQ